MPRGTLLSQYEQGRIQALHSKDFGVKEIAEELNRSEKVVSNFLKTRENYGKNKTGGPKPKLSDRERRLIINKASNGHTSCANLARLVQNKVTRQTVWNILHESKFMVYQKMRTAPKLTANHKIKRLGFAKNNMNTNWSKTIFSDEKKWNLDGPDGWNGYWRDLRKEPQIFSKRNFGGGSLMTWGAFAAVGVLDLQIVSTKMNSMEYINVLECSLLPYLRQCGQAVVFQQDNAPIHNSKQTRDFLNDHNIDVVDWPACSPDLNPIENIWGILARRVYKGKGQFNNTDELKNAVLDEWHQIDEHLIIKLIESMPDRIFECIRKNGAATHY